MNPDDYETGEIIEAGTEIATVDKSSAASVITYLSQARDWLATCVEMTGPAEIANVKAQIATAAEATKQLHLSKDIQLDAQEMVRRAEYALGKAIRKGQAEGAIHTHGGPRRGDGSSSVTPTLKSPSEFATKQELSGAGHGQPGIYSLADETPDVDDFEAALTEAKAEGNLSRANVARKAREKSGRSAPTTRERSLQESELITAFRSMIRPLLAPKNVASLSPKSRALLVELLERAIQTLKGTDL